MLDESNIQKGVKISKVEPFDKNDLSDDDLEMGFTSFKAGVVNQALSSKPDMPYKRKYHRLYSKKKLSESDDDRLK